MSKSNLEWLLSGSTCLIERMEFVCFYSAPTSLIWELENMRRVGLNNYTQKRKEKRKEKTETTTFYKLYSEIRNSTSNWVVCFMVCFFFVMRRGKKPVCVDPSLLHTQDASHWTWLSLTAAQKGAEGGSPETGDDSSPFCGKLVGCGWLWEDQGWSEWTHDTSITAATCLSTWKDYGWFKPAFLHRLHLTWHEKQWFYHITCAQSYRTENILPLLNFGKA